MSVRIAKAKRARKVASPLEESTEPSPMRPCTRLVCVRIDHEAWAKMNPTARRMLRAPIAWRESKNGPRAVPLNWHVGREAYAYVVEGSAHAREIADVAAALGVELRSAAWPHLLRRIPAGGLFTDPSRTGTKADVETTGLPLLLRNRRGRWKRYDARGASLWPKDAQEQLAEHVAGTEGWPAPPPALAPKRYAVEEGTPRVNASLLTSYKWQERSAWLTLDEARAEAERAAIADARVDRDTRWRVVDRGTGARRAIWQRRKVLKSMRLTRLDRKPGFVDERPTPVAVDVPRAGAP